MSELDARVSALLERYMSRILAQSVRRRALTALGLEVVAREQLPALRRQLEAGIRLFVDAHAQGQVARELDALCAELAPVVEAQRVTVRDESDIARARTRARELAEQLGGSSFVAQRAATAASELARNIVAYAREGAIELVPRPERAVLTIRAEDQGPGIEDPDAILEGRYRSRTGLGMGLRGVRRLAARFSLETGAGGTRVEADIEM